MCGGGPEALGWGPWAGGWRSAGSAARFHLHPLPRFPTLQVRILGEAYTPDDEEDSAAEQVRACSLLSYSFFAQPALLGRPRCLPHALPVGIEGSA